MMMVEMETALELAAVGEDGGRIKLHVFSSLSFSESPRYLCGHTVIHTPN